MTTARKVFAYSLAVFGVLGLAANLVFYYWKAVPIRPWPVVIPMLLGFVGFYLVDPKGAKDSGGFVEQFTIRVLKTIRTGRTSVTVETDGTPPTVVDPSHPNRPIVTDHDNGVG